MTRPDDKELKPCPFCGGDAETQLVNQLELEEAEYATEPFYVVSCLSTLCGAQICSSPWQAMEPMDAWNTRAHDNLKAECARLRDVIQIALDDMKERMDMEEGCERKTMCCGHKNPDGSYTFPMGNGAYIGLIQALEQEYGE